MSYSAPTTCETRAAIGTADTPAEPISGLIGLLGVSLFINLASSTPPAVEKPKANPDPGAVAKRLILPPAQRVNSKSENDAQTETGLSDEAILPPLPPDRRRQK